MFDDERFRPDYSAKNISSLLQKEEFEKIATLINQRFELVGNGVVTADWVRTHTPPNQSLGAEGPRNDDNYFNWFKRKLDDQGRLSRNPYDRTETEAEQVPGAFAGTLNMLDMGNYLRVPCDASDGQFLNPGSSSAARSILSDYQGRLVPIDLTAARVAPLPGSGAE